MKYLIGYEAKVNRIIDGDTFDVDINLGFDLTIKNQRIRLLGVNTPETKGDLKEYGLYVKSIVEKMLIVDSTVIIETLYDTKRDSFGRVLAYVKLPSGLMLTQYLLANHLGVVYSNDKDLMQQRLTENYGKLKCLGLL